MNCSTPYNYVAVLSVDLRVLQHALMLRGKSKYLR